MPASTSVTEPPDAVHTQGVTEPMVTGSPEVEVPVTVKGPVSSPTMTTRGGN